MENSRRREVVAGVQLVEGDGDGLRPLAERCSKKIRHVKSFLKR